RRATASTNLEPRSRSTEGVIDVAGIVTQEVVVGRPALDEVPLGHRVLTSSAGVVCGADISERQLLAKRRLPGRLPGEGDEQLDGVLVRLRGVLRLAELVLQHSQVQPRPRALGRGGVRFLVDRYVVRLDGELQTPAAVRVRPDRRGTLREGLGQGLVLN